MDPNTDENTHSDPYTHPYSDAHADNYSDPFSHQHTYADKDLNRQPDSDLHIVTNAYPDANCYLDTHSFPDPVAHAGSSKPGNQPPGDGIVLPGCRTHWRNGCG